MAVTRVLILDPPSPLACRSGVAMGSQGLMVWVDLDYNLGWVLCKPDELAADTLPQWLPVWLRLVLYKTRRKWREYREQRSYK